MNFKVTHDLVRPSRDGDQFHYAWAARQCLRLLDPRSDLRAISIEGSADRKSIGTSQSLAGEDKIDVAEYYGSESIARATRISYIQLKHSTLQANKEWTFSGLKGTLIAFHEYFAEKRQKFASEGVTGPELQFSFLSNRPISSKVLQTLIDADRGQTPAHVPEMRKLKAALGNKPTALSDFCGRVKLIGTEPGYLEQQFLLTDELGNILPEIDEDASIRLRDLVTRKATSQGTKNSVITRIDVLRALRATEEALLPAPSRIIVPANVVPRADYLRITEEVVRNESATPTLVVADAGVGKSVAASQIANGLPIGSVCVVYDCYGSGKWRTHSQRRDRHRDALVQIINELSIKGLCDPLIPGNVDASKYIKTFHHRLRQAVAAVRALHVNALVVIVVDAADNAEMAAHEFDDKRSFARDLLQEQSPEGCRLVMFGRPHRVDNLLTPPSSLLRLTLHPFTEEETTAHLRSRFPEASKSEIKEFHFLSSANPRVQAIALMAQLPIADIIRRLGPNPTTVDSTIAALHKAAVEQLKEDAHKAEGIQVERFCAGLTSLPPLVPIPILSAMSGIEESAIRSFATSLSSALVLNSNCVQFRDEPSEDWFRRTFRPRSAQLKEFVSALQPLASREAYVSRAMPRLMLEAEMLDELIEMTLSSVGLPDGQPAARREIEAQRFQFALRASMKRRRYLDAAKLAQKAGTLAAGKDREHGLLRSNISLAAITLDSDGIRELVSQRVFQSGGAGPHYAYEAALMAAKLDLHPEARNKARLANAWQKHSKENRLEDIVELAFAEHELNGPAACVRYLSSWSRKSTSFKAGKRVTRRLLNKGLDLVLQFARASIGNPHLFLAIVSEVNPSTPLLESRVVRRAMPGIEQLRPPTPEFGSDDLHLGMFEAVCMAVAVASRQRVATRKRLVALLSAWLPASPPQGLGSRFFHGRLAYLKAYALLSALQRKPLKLVDVADQAARQILLQPRHSGDDRARELRENIEPLLRWSSIWAEAALGQLDSADVGSHLRKAAEAFSIHLRSAYYEKGEKVNELVRMWMDVLSVSCSIDEQSFRELDDWCSKESTPLYPQTLIRLARCCATATLRQTAISYASRAFELEKGSRDNAEEKGNAYATVAEAVIAASVQDAAAYFEAALDVAGTFGDEIHDRWTAVLDLADRATEERLIDSEFAYLVSRCAEIAAFFIGDKHFDWNRTVRAIAALSPSSCLQALSRWRDRRVSEQTYLLPIATRFMIESGDLTPTLVMALRGFQYRWDDPFLLSGAFEQHPSEDEKALSARFVLHYVGLSKVSKQTWIDLKELLDLHGIESSLVNSHNQAKSDSNHEASDETRFVREIESPQWEEIFLGLDVSTPSGLQTAFGRIPTSIVGNHAREFFKHACQLVPVDRRAAFIEALADVEHFAEFEWTAFLEELPPEWLRQQPSVTKAVQTTLRKLCRRWCWSIDRSAYYRPFSVAQAAQLIGLSEESLIDEVLEALEETTELFSARRLFTLVGLLSAKLTPSQASDALRYGVGLFDGVVAEQHPEGTLSQALVPPKRAETALMGYIWATLGAPEASLRWQAAHAVCGLLKWGRDEDLRDLLAFTEVDIPVGFVDHRFPFYALHATQWLLIALARGAKDHPERVLLFADFLERHSEHSEKHVLIRHFAADALLTINSSRSKVMPPSVVDRLRQTNRSWLPHMLPSRYQGGSSRYGDFDSDRSFFFPDVGPYWIEPLATAFGIGTDEASRETRHAIRSLGTGLEEGGRHEDPRHAQGIFHDRETSHSHGSYPRADDLFFYSCYHAIMRTAGQFLDRLPVRKEQDEDLDEFEQWFRGQGLTRSDGFWLSDMRDPDPAVLKARESLPDDLWQWTVKKADFEAVLRENDLWNVWGQEIKVEGRQRENVMIRSALVHPETSASLLRSLSSSDPSFFALPRYEDDHDIEREPFRLRAWISDQYGSRRLDEGDPWSGEAHFPMLAPAPPIVELLGIEADEHRRVWRMRSQPCGLVASTWGDRSRDDQPVAYGNRLRCTGDFLTTLLERCSSDLIVEVRIERQLSRFYSERRSDAFEYLPPSVRYFVMSKDGTLTSV